MSTVAELLNSALRNIDPRSEAHADSSVTEAAPSVVSLLKEESGRGYGAGLKWLFP